MINHGFRRLALAHSLLPAVTEVAQAKSDAAAGQKLADQSAIPVADALDAEATAQDHPSIHM
jgi:hypothetical protein